MKRLFLAVLLSLSLAVVGAGERGTSNEETARWS